MELAPASLVPEADLPLLVHILNAAWGDFFTVTPAILSERFASDQLFVVARDQGTEEELEFIAGTYGIFPEDDRIPLGILETIDASTAGDPARLPRQYDQLTGQGRWRPPLPGSDTLVLVDLTVATSRRGSGAGEALLLEAIRRRERPLRHVFTYSPHLPGIVAWHQRRGAVSTGTLFRGARPGHVPADVAVMDYTALALDLMPDSV